MKKLVEIWDYFMRRKVLLLMILSIIALDGIIIERLTHRPNSEQLASDLATTTKLLSELRQSDREQLIEIIEDYQAKTPTEVLKQPNVDMAKTKVLLAYQALGPEDQAPYKEFISQVHNGSAPVIRFFGKTTYYLNDEVDANDLVRVSDKEDGDIIYKLVTETNLNTSKVGDYYAHYTATDSDGNITQLKVDFKVVNPQPTATVTPEPEPKPQQPQPVQPKPKPTLPTTDSTIKDDLQPDQLPDDNQTAVEEKPTQSNQPDKDNSQNPDSLIGAGINHGDNMVSEDNPQATKTSEFNLGQTIALAVAGLVFLALLVRFIFDHYVR